MDRPVKDNRVALRSEAFRFEELRSERARIKWTIGVLLAIGALIIIRRVVFQTEADHHLLLLSCPVLGIAVLYEWVLLIWLSRQARRHQAVPEWAWYLNVMLESLFPSCVLLILTSTPSVGPYRALSVPALYLFLCDDLVDVEASSHPLNHGGSRFSGGLFVSDPIYIPNIPAW